MRLLFVLTLLTLTAVGIAAQAPTPELKVGDQAPDFTLQASDGKTYKLSDFKGKQAVVLAWFPKAYTSGCTIECKSLAEHGDMIKKYNVTYFMASVDPLDQNKGFAEQQHADFPLLSDPDKQTAQAYGVLNDLRRRATVDVLHRQRRQDPRGRQDREARNVRRGHGRQARRAAGRTGSLKGVTP